ncbi:hypothetical protein BDW74DRAFT_145220 [Aspergillus multicolor]|uniref:uncharacterized protein n=1 Tax=Aspergillus multicolor TaxID=41759 RepID=UPI003CCC9E06
MPIGSYPEALSIIKLAARIQRLACVCLAISRENFVTAVGKAYGTQRGHCKRAQMAGEPFSWMEEYRVYWSLWRLQHYSLLRGAATGRWGWDKMSLMDLDAYLVWTSIDERLAERIWTVAALLSDLGLETVYGHYSLQHKPKSFSQYPYSKRDFLAQESEGQESFRAAWTFPRETPIPFIARLDLLSHARHGRTIATLLPSWTPPPVPDKNEATVAWRLLPEYSSSEQEHLEDIRRFARVDSSLVRPSYTMADMKPWRRLGIALWDSWRMTTAGLFQCLSPGRVPVTDIGSIPDLRGRLEIDTSLALMVGRFFPTA